jgi:hypothetical protein
VVGSPVVPRLGTTVGTPLGLGVGLKVGLFVVGKATGAYDGLDVGDEDGA